MDRDARAYQNPPVNPTVSNTLSEARSHLSDAMGTIQEIKSRLGIREPEKATTASNELISNGLLPAAGDLNNLTIRICSELTKIVEVI